MNALPVETQFTPHTKPLWILQEEFNLLTPILDGKCIKCNIYVLGSKLLEEFKTKGDGIAHCNVCKECLTIQFLMKPWSNHSKEVPYFTKLEVQTALSACIFPAEQLDDAPIPTPLLVAVRYHFGTLKKAYEKLQTEYTYPEIRNWEKRVIRFLPDVPDEVLSAEIGVPVNEIAALRAKIGIPSPSLQRWEMLNKLTFPRKKMSGSIKVVLLPKIDHIAERPKVFRYLAVLSPCLSVYEDYSVQWKNVINNRNI